MLFEQTDKLLHVRSVQIDVVLDALLLLDLIDDDLKGCLLYTSRCV